MEIRMFTNHNLATAPAVVLLALAAALVSGCATAPFAHQRTAIRTDATTDQATTHQAAVRSAPLASRQDAWRTGLDALSQTGLATPAVEWNAPHQADAEAPTPAVLHMRDVSASAERVANIAPRTVLRAETSTFDQHVLASDVPVLVDFYAEWCGPCKALAPTLDQLAAENPQVRVVKVDIDESPELAARYGVRSVPRLMVFKGGQIAAQQSGVASKSRLTAMLGLSVPGHLD
jgi:thioredoxin 1